MSALLTIFTAVTATLGIVFFTAGTIGLLRFGDVRGRLHALTKADTLGLGLVMIALMPHVGSVAAAVKLLLIWVLALAAASASAHVLGRREADVAVIRAEQEEAQ